MVNTYFNIPLELTKIKNKEDISKINLKQSIHNMLHLICTTSFGELKHDPDFGSEIWQYDFINIYNLNNFKENLRKSISTSIKKNERRLKNINIEIQIEQIELKFVNKRTKVRINLHIEGIIDKTNEQFKHQEMFFIGPLSYN